MIRRLGKLPGKLYLAYSGGMDSSVILHFLLKSKRNVTLAYFDHGTEHGKEALEFTKGNAKRLGVNLVVGKILTPLPHGCSKEAYWRNERYAFLHSLEGPVITCHHLNDVAETWVFSSLHGNPKIIPYQNRNVIRPFLPTSRHELEEWSRRFPHSIKWIEDPSNTDTAFARNQIRHNILPECLKVNPGILKVMRKKVLASYGNV